MIIEPTTRKLIGKVFPVSWDAALALRDLGLEFFLLIGRNSTLDNQLEKTLVSFIQHYSLALYVVTVSIVDYPDAASQLGVAYLPQVRLYRNGKEAGRHRGLATYALLHEIVGR